MPRVEGKSTRIKIGTYPTVSLADAREKAREILSRAQRGLLNKSVIAAERSATLGEMVPQFIELYAMKRNKDWKETESVLKKFTSLNNRPLKDIKRPDVVRVLDEIAGVTPVRANRAMAAIKKLFSWCVDRGNLEYNPLAGLKPPTKEVPRDRVLSDKELTACWQAADRNAGRLVLAFSFSSYGTASRRSIRHAVVRSRPRKWYLDNPGQAGKERHSSHRAVGALGAGYPWISAPFLEFGSGIHH